jgi:UDP-N-acetylglucosamine/UDP-N-acetylgalactosamine diphosphorylase
MNILSMYGQKGMKEQIAKLSSDAKKSLLEQIEGVHIDTLLRQRAVLYQPQHQQREVSPFYTFARSGNVANKERGLDAIASGQVACLIVAGGQGTRLGFSGPKGMFPITPVKKKSLFQLFAEKTVAASRMANTPLSIAIMTSPINHEETVHFYTANNYFGLTPQQVSFFPQQMLPFLDAEGSLFLSSPEKLAEGPDGNGGALHNLVHSGIWKQWLHHGISYVNVVLVDNALADPFDAELVGYMIEQHDDVAIKCTLRTDESENVGVIAQEKGKVVVVEYTEMPKSEYTSRTEDGQLRYNCANLSLFCMRMDFIKSVAQKPDLLPLHKAFKATPYVDGNGTVVTPTKPNAWKFERFIFDILTASTKTGVLVYPREACFAPLKNGSGPYSPETVQADIEARDRAVLREVYGIEPAKGPLELSQDFHYPTASLLKKWKGKKVAPTGYLEP